MKASPLEIEKYLFEESSVKVNNHFDSESDAHNAVTISMEIGVQFRPHKTDVELYQIEVSLKVPEVSDDSAVEISKKYPYQISMSVLGKFRIPGATNFTKASIEQLLSVDAVSILYSAIREQIITITARSKHSVFCLPSLSFSSVKIDDILIPPQKLMPTKARNKKIAKNSD